MRWNLAGDEYFFIPSPISRLCKIMISVFGKRPQFQYRWGFSGSDQACWSVGHEWFASWSKSSLRPTFHGQLGEVTQYLKNELYLYENQYLAEIIFHPLHQNIRWENA